MNSDIFSFDPSYMYWFADTGTAQQISTAKLPTLSKKLKKCMVIKGLA